MGQKRIAVVACGNRTRSDDGIGIEIVNKLKRGNDLKDTNIEYHTDGWGALDALGSYQSLWGLIVVDALDLGAAPGTVGVFDLKDAQLYKPSTSHDISLIELINIQSQILKISFLSKVVGIQFKNLEWGEIFSTEVLAGVPLAENYIKDLISIWRKNARTVTSD